MSRFTPRTSGAWAYEPRKPAHTPLKVWVFAVIIIAISGLSIHLADRALGKARHDAAESIALSALFQEGF